MRISIIGAGYVGIVTAACLADLGHTVTLVDVDKDRVSLIARGMSPIHEPGLNELLRRVSIKATPDYSMTSNSSIIFIAVGTPSNDTGSMCLQYILDASRQLADVLRDRNDYFVVVVKSSVLPGTTEEAIIPAIEASGKKAGRHFGVCMEPEFLREGKAIHYYMNPARIVIGEYDTRSGDALLTLHAHSKAPVVRTNLRTAEMIKLASNTFLATKISFINEIGNMCKALDIDAYEVARGMGFDERIGSKFLNAGVGFGGSCLPKDLRALVSKARQIGCEPRMLESVLQVNDEQSLRMIDLLKKHLSLEGANVGILGLAFKPNTGDIRESKAIKIAEMLLKEGARVKAYDPIATQSFRRLFPQIDYTSAEGVLGCDAVLIVTEWPEFEHLDYRGKIVIDGRRVQKARQARIYEGICW